MARTTGVTALSPKRKLFGSGVWIVNYDPTKTIAANITAAATAGLLWATTGGNEFIVHQKLGGTDYDGQLGPVKGSRNLTEDYATGSGTGKDLGLAALLTQLPGATYTDSTTGTNLLTTHADVVTRTRDILATDHINNVALICDHAAADGSIGFILNNVLGGSDTFDVKTADKEAAPVTFSFTSYYDPAAMATRPWSIIWPDATVTTDAI